MQKKISFFSLGCHGASQIPHRCSSMTSPCKALNLSSLIPGLLNAFLYHLIRGSCYFLHVRVLTSPNLDEQVVIESNSGFSQTTQMQFCSEKPALGRINMLVGFGVSASSRLELFVIGSMKPSHLHLLIRSLAILCFPSEA